MFVPVSQQHQMPLQNSGNAQNVYQVSLNEGKENAAASQQNKKTKTDKGKFKTEMCKNWIEVGTCRYGNKC